MSCAMGGQEEHGETADQTSEGIKGAKALDSIKEPPHEPLGPPGTRIHPPGPGAHSVDGHGFGGTPGVGDGQGGLAC